MAFESRVRHTRNSTLGHDEPDARDERGFGGFPTGTSAAGGDLQPLGGDPDGAQAGGVQRLHRQQGDGEAARTRVPGAVQGHEGVWNECRAQRRPRVHAECRGGDASGGGWLRCWYSDTEADSACGCEKVLHGRAEFGGQRVLTTNFPSAADPSLFVGVDLDTAARAIYDETAKQTDLVFMNGVSAWSPGQLDNELKQGSWVVVQAPVSLAINAPVDLWQDLMRTLGGEYAEMSRMPPMEEE
ncbi:unnamed protein product [Phytophthora fragariaefolia]|uniref:Unnamed protein product n=1 Tax=Phytophthora fragariaefolia TaxID=1490495 RepID=A0A9W6X0E2_9STRA|nr:unnamed protein product [Phytophthora fragariaefolia]